MQLGSTPTRRPGVAARLAQVGRSRAATVVTAAAIVVAVGASGVVARHPVSAQSAAPTAAPIAPQLAGVPVDTSGFAQIHAELLAAVDLADRTRTDLADTRAAIPGLRATAAETDGRLAGLEADLDELRGSMNDLAVGAYINGGFDATVPLDTAVLAGGDEALEAVADQALAGITQDAQLEQHRDTRLARNDARDESDRAAAAVDDAVTREADLAETLTGAEATAARLRNEEASLRVLATVEGVDFPLIVLDAYWRAAAAQNAANPACRVTWWALAGIGKVESGHGTFGGATVAADGTVTTPIIGIPLPAIGDTDGGVLDGDPAVDHAVGPMQFIPSTWAASGVDGNGDGRADPQNIYDAARSAAGYLCAASPNLDTDAALRIAYFSYNRSGEYVDLVLGHARRYQAAVTSAP